MQGIREQILETVKAYEANGVSSQAREISDSIDWQESPNKLVGHLTRLADEGKLHYIPPVRADGTLGRWTTIPLTESENIFKQFAAHPMRIGDV